MTQPNSGIDDVIEFSSSQDIDAPYVPRTRLQQERSDESRFVGKNANTALCAITNADKLRRTDRFIGLPKPGSDDPVRAAAAASDPMAAARIPQDDPLWLDLRARKVTGSSLACLLGFFEKSAGYELRAVGVKSAFRDHDKMVSKLASMWDDDLPEVPHDPITKQMFEWGHRHEANGVLTFLENSTDSAVLEVGFVLLQPERLPAGVVGSTAVGTLPPIGSSPDGLVVVAGDIGAVGTRRCPPFSVDVDVLEVKAKFPFVRQRDDTLRFIGRRCAPYKFISAQYFCQAQLNMLVTGAKHCRFVVYTPYAGSSLMVIPFHEQWCREMLRWVAEINIRFIRTHTTPFPDVLWTHPEYRRFVYLTRDICARLAAPSAGFQYQHVDSCNGVLRTPLFDPPADSPPESDPDPDITQDPEADAALAALEAAGEAGDEAAPDISDTQLAQWRGDSQSDSTVSSAGVVEWSPWEPSVSAKVSELWATGQNLAELLDGGCWACIPFNPPSVVCHALEKVVAAVRRGSVRNASALFMFFIQAGRGGRDG